MGKRTEFGDTGPQFGRRFIKKSHRKIETAILCVTKDQAQVAADLLSKAGLRRF